MTWKVRADGYGTITEEQAAAIVETGAMAHWNTERQQFGTLFDVEAETLFEANAAAIARLNEYADLGVPAITQIVIRAHGHYGVAVPLMSIQTIADHLGVSAAAVRQSKSNELEFPTPISVPGVAADLYDGDEAFDYITARKGAKALIGRPREGDDQLFTQALIAIRLAQPMMMFDQDAVLQKAIEAQGGRYVRGKAKVLLDFMKRPYELGEKLRDPEFARAVARAHEMWDD